MLGPDSVAMRLALCALVPSVVLFAGCGTFGDCGRIACGPCPPPLTIAVLDLATGEALTEATIDHPSGSCSEGTCLVGDAGEGEIHLVVSAPGYADRAVHERLTPVDSGGCCSCGFEAKTIEVRLTPL